ncbi:MAG: hypothetical protein ACLFN5_02820 [bacterium]
MKKNQLMSMISGLAVGLFFAVGVLLMPGVSWAPPLIKMGVVNWERVVGNYEDFQRNIAEAEHRRETMIQFIEEQYGELGDAEELDEEMDEMYRETLLEIEERRERIVREAHREIFNVIEEEAINQGFSLILSENEVLYASEDYTDITRDVLRRLNGK